MKLKEFDSVEEANNWIRSFNVKVVSIHPFMGFHRVKVVIVYQ